MTFTPDSILALLALLVMLGPALRLIYRFLQRRYPPSHSSDEEAAGIPLLAVIPYRALYLVFKN
jgi:hypothetical protein